MRCCADLEFVTVAAALVVSEHGYVRRRILGSECMRHGQCAELIGLQGNLLSKHDVARDEITDGHKTPTNFRVSRIVDLTLPVTSGMAGIPKIAFYEQYPTRVQAVTVVNEDQRATLASEGVDCLTDAPAVNSMNTRA